MAENTKVQKVLGILVSGGILAAIVAFTLPKLFSVNKPPSAVININTQKGDTPLKIFADGFKSSDPESSKLTYAWSFNDQHFSSEEQFEFVLSEPGNYNLVLTVTDKKGLVGKDRKLIEVVRPDHISTQYSRLTGAFEVPILIQIQTAGGVWAPSRDRDLVNIGKEDTNWDAMEYPVQSGHVSFSFSEFWETWPFKNALPMGTPLWKEIAGDGMFGRDYLLGIDKDFENCLTQLIQPELMDESDRDPNCDRSISDKVGFLFLIFENSSGETLSNLVIEFEQLDDSIPVDAYLKNLSADDQSIPNNQLVLPSLKAEQQVIFLLSVYEALDTGFEAGFTTGPIIPRNIHYEIGGKAYSYPVPEPLREKAATVKLPYGWYLQ